jgi:cytosolic iron-sulfur protein assembly protein CIAO1
MVCDFEPKATLEGHENEVKSVAWSNNADFLATCSRDKTIWIFEPDEVSEMEMVGETDDLEYSCASVLNGHEGDVKQIKWHPDRDHLFSASYDDTIKCWAYEPSMEDWICVYTIKGHSSTVWCLDFDPSGNFLVSCSEDKSWILWRITEKGYSKLATVAGDHFRSVYSISWAPKPLSGKHYIASVGSDN